MGAPAPRAPMLLTPVLVSNYLVHALQRRQLAVQQTNSCNNLPSAGHTDSICVFLLPLNEYAWLHSFIMLEKLNQRNVCWLDGDINH